jgi:hypothetical protein
MKPARVNSSLNRRARGARVPWVRGLVAHAGTVVYCVSVLDPSPKWPKISNVKSEQML